jgi:hypothetical protein
MPFCNRPMENVSRGRCEWPSGIPAISHTDLSRCCHFVTALFGFPVTYKAVHGLSRRLYNGDAVHSPVPHELAGRFPIGQVFVSFKRRTEYGQDEGRRFRLQMMAATGSEATRYLRGRKASRAASTASAAVVFIASSRFCP